MPPSAQPDVYISNTPPHERFFQGVIMSDWEEFFDKAGQVGDDPRIRSPLRDDTYKAFFARYKAEGLVGKVTWADAPDWVREAMYTGIWNRVWEKSAILSEVAYPESECKPDR